MTTQTNASQTVECPRCYGTKKFQQYAHVAEGKCFLCAGVGRVIASKVPPTVARKAEPMSAERARLKLVGMFAGAKREGRDWLDDESTRELAATLKAAAPEVQQKAKAAFAKLFGGSWVRVERAMAA